MLIELLCDYNFSRSETSLKNVNFFSIYKGQKLKTAMSLKLIHSFRGWRQFIERKVSVKNNHDSEMCLFEWTFFTNKQVFKYYIQRVIQTNLVSR